MRVAVKKAVKFLSAEAWKDYVIRPLDNLAQALTSEEALEAYIRETSIIAAHPVGSAAMSPKNATWGVVDPDLLLKGGTGIRIIDASVMVSTQISGILYNLTENAAICSKWTYPSTDIRYRRERCGPDQTKMDVDFIEPRSCFCSMKSIHYQITPSYFART